MKNKLKLIVPVYLGTLLEWYDFSIFVFLAPILSNLFFPTSDKLISILMTYAVFSIGFIARPLGSIVFGQYADNHGRKKSMLLSMMIISISTAVIGLLPTYKEIGICAPLGMIILRIIQGFCIGGESSGAAIYVIETYPSKYRGTLSSLMWSAAGFGLLLGSAFITLVFYLFTIDQLNSGYWRLPFLMSVLTGIVGLYFRQKIPETTLYQVYRSNNDAIKKKAHKIIFENKKTIFTIILLYGLSSIITYVLFVFMPVYISRHNDIDLKTASLITTIALSIVTILVPLSGYFSDLLGRKFCLYSGSIGFLILSIPLYIYMNIEKTVLSFIISDVIFVLLAILYQGALTAAVQETTNTNNRFTITSVGYNISYGFFGGTAPLFVSWISEISGIQIIPGIYLSFFAFLSLVAIYGMKETYKTQLS
ncbi:MAG: MFS transporter [Silvanigrellaceae bacterium]|nr:MFS transporter [Silvanigrellaceae bacterium]